MFFPLYKYTCMYMFVHTLTVVTTQGQKEHELTSFYKVEPFWLQADNTMCKTTQCGSLSSQAQSKCDSPLDMEGTLKQDVFFFFAIIGDKFRLRYFKNQHPRSKLWIILWEFYFNLDGCRTGLKVLYHIQK